MGVLLTPVSAGGTWKLVVRVKGKVQSRFASANRWIPVFSSRLLEDGNDRVRTQADSVAQLRGSDDSIINVGPDTELAIEEYVPEEARAVLKIKNPGGSVFVKLGRFLKGQRSFVVETPNSVLSASGTSFIVVYGAAGMTTMDVLSGTVSGTHGNKPVSVPAGHRFTTDGKTFSLQKSPPDFQGVPQVLVPAGTRGTKAAMQKGTTMVGDTKEPTGGADTADATDTGGVYLNALEPDIATDDGNMHAVPPGHF